jgi:hypothetical protein
MKYEDYPIIVWDNDYFPDVVYYKCTVNDETLISTTLDIIREFRKDKVDNAAHYAECKRLSDIACATFMADVKYKD